MSLDHVVQALRSSVSLDAPGAESMSAWFHGPTGENGDLLRRLLSIAVDDHSVVRKVAYPDDPPWADTTTAEHRRTAEMIERQLQVLIRRMSDFSVPWYSYRYHAHMNWDVSLPALAGYVAAVLYNQNNVAGEGSPVTTALEMEVAADLCRMIGFESNPKTGAEPWAHLTSGGTVANTEAMWAHRNLKLYPFAVKQALVGLGSRCGDFMVTCADGTRAELVRLEPWDLINLPLDEVVDLLPRLREEKGLGEAELSVVDEHSVQKLGLSRFGHAHRCEAMVRELAFVTTATHHYSMPKAATLLGMGMDSLVSVPFDARARMSIPHLREMLESRRRSSLPVAAVVAVLGSTQEGAVDPLAEILEVRKDLRKEGLDFAIHVDAAWGAYFASLLRGGDPPSEAEVPRGGRPRKGPRPMRDEDPRKGAQATVDQLREMDAHAEAAHERLVYVSELMLSEHVRTQLRALPRADSVTVDPHKSGFAPYPAGALCYRRREIPEMVQYHAPVVYHDGRVPTVGTFGIEGSRPGAAAAAVWLSHRIIRPDRSGYGRILGRCMFNANRLIGAIATMESDLFIVRTLQSLRHKDQQRLAGLNHLSNRELFEVLRQDREIARVFLEFGSDLVINTYALNLRHTDGTLNQRPELADELNDRVFRRLSLEHEGDEWPVMIITASEYDPKVTGSAFVDHFRERLGLHRSRSSMRYLISTTANPWLTDTDGGKTNMVPVLVKQLQSVVESEVREMRQIHKL